MANKKKKTFSSVAEMLQDVSVDKRFCDDFERHSAERSLIRHLFAMRTAKGKSQKDIAESLGCSQSRVSKLENGTDGDLRLGDLQGYLGALGLDCRLVVTKQGSTVVDAVKYHAWQIKRLLDCLAKLAHGDAKIAEGVTGFFGEAFFNLIRLLQDSAEKLPCKEDGTPYMKIELQEEHEEEEINPKLLAAEPICARKGG